MRSGILKNKHGRYPALSLLLAAGTIVCLAAGGMAGTICGTVRDVYTSGPVTRAGIFVRTPAGEYTGYYGATDDVGRFCIDGIPAGTYDLEVRRDYYETCYIPGVVVTGDVTSVDIDLFNTEHYLAAPWPNPAQSGISFKYRIGYPVPVKLLIYDVRGRLVHGWKDSSPSTGEHFFVWDLRGRDGQRVPSGVYFVRFDAGSVNQARSIVILK